MFSVIRFASVMSMSSELWPNTLLKLKTPRPAFYDLASHLPTIAHRAISGIAARPRAP